MRNECLTGYVLHQKPYGESRSLIYFFSHELGMIHGIGKKNLPLFRPITLFATGKNALKTFSQSQLVSGSSQAIGQQLTGQALFAGMYLNELLVKLLPIEESVPTLWTYYQAALLQINQPVAALCSNLEEEKQAVAIEPLTWLKFVLRRFETALLLELGYALDVSQDSLGNKVEPNQLYQYRLQQGFVPIVDSSQSPKQQTMLGAQLQAWQSWLDTPDAFLIDYGKDPNVTTTTINKLGQSYRLVIDDLLNYEVLQSRELWRQLTQFS